VRAQMLHHFKEPDSMRVALLTGVALIQLRGGFGAVPSLMTDFDS